MTITAAGRPLRRRLLVLLGALATFGPLSIDLYLPGLNGLADDLSASASATQLTITGTLIGLAIGQLIAGPVSDAMGRRRPLLAGVGLFVLTSLLCAAAPNIWVLVVARVLQGCGGAVGVVIAMAMVRDLVDGNEVARVYALLMLVTGLAPMLAPLVGGQLLLVTDWRGAFVALALIGLALFTVTCLALPETLPPEQRRRGGAVATGQAIAGLLRDRWFVALATCSALAFATLMVYIAGGVFLLENLHGVSPQVVGMIFAGNSLMMVAFSQLSARLVRETGPARLLAIGLALGASAGVALLVAVVASLSLAVIIPCLALMIGSRGFVIPNAQALAVSHHPEAAGTATGLVGVCRFGAGGSLAPLVGVAGTHNAVPMAVLVCATSMGATVALALGLRERRRPRTAKGAVESP